MYFYDDTQKYGKNLYETLEDRHFDKWTDQQSDYFSEAAKVGGDSRENFIDYLTDKLDEDDLDEAMKQAGHTDIELFKVWLKDNQCPGLGRYKDEDYHISNWACNEANFSGELLINDLKAEDDVQVALTFGFVKYPPFVEDKYVDGGKNCIPAVMANEIRRLNCEDGKDKEAAELERKAVLNLITVSGFKCSSCGSENEIKSVPLGEIPACQCGTHLCDRCCNQSSKVLNNEEEMEEVLLSIVKDDPLVCCGYCGKGSASFLKFFCESFNIAPSLPEIGVLYAGALEMALEDEIKGASKELDEIMEIFYEGESERLAA